MGGGLVAALTYKVFVPAVDGQVTQCNGHCPHYLVGVGAEKLHQDGQAFLLADCGTDVVRPLQREREGKKACS